MHCPIAWCNAEHTVANWQQIASRRIAGILNATHKPVLRSLERIDRLTDREIIEHGMSPLKLLHLAVDASLPRTLADGLPIAEGSFGITLDLACSNRNAASG